MACYRDVMEGIGTAVDAVGVFMIVLGALLAFSSFVDRGGSQASRTVSIDKTWDGPSCWVLSSSSQATLFGRSSLRPRWRTS
jgi:hypothetical protein